jgi:hypothetical protein
VSKDKFRKACADCLTPVKGTPEGGWPECGPICHQCAVRRYKTLAEQPDRVKAWKLRDELFYIAGRLRDIKWPESAAVVLEAMLFIERMVPAPRADSRVGVAEFKERARVQMEKARAERAERAKARLERLARPCTGGEPRWSVGGLLRGARRWFGK